MDIYLVGGAIRDQLLGLPVKERDWVIVGSSPEEMLALGYTPVGKDFPVFLHPETHEEYALARTERKVAKGYKGFTFHADPNVTLEEDLKRRDLTINTLAQSDGGELIDMYNGQQDLQRKQLHHVSPAFAEDPVRILRVARFASKLPGFTVHPDTNSLMQSMVSAGEVDALTAERVWKEFERALQCNSPWRFIEVLQDCHALAVLFPTIILDDTMTQRFHQFCTLHSESVLRFASFCYDLNKTEVTALCQRYRVPNHYKSLAIVVSQHQNNYHAITINDPEAILELLKCTDAIRKPERFNAFLTCCNADNTTDNHKRNQLLLEALQQIKSIDTSSIQQSGVTGVEFAKALYSKQLSVLQQWFNL